MRVLYTNSVSYNSHEIFYDIKGEKKREVIKKLNELGL